MALAESPSFIASDVLEAEWGAFYSSGGFDRCLLIADQYVTELHPARLAPFLREMHSGDCYYISGGEAVKSLPEVVRLVHWLMEHEATRRTLLVAVGGGALLDFVGFVAAIYKRGIPCIYVPTTLMAMIDASIGGKTAIDHEGVKNILGAFALPRAVFIDPLFLRTLPTPEILSGYWELVKYGLLSSCDLWQRIKAFDPLESSEGWLPFIRDCVAIKESFVARDFMDKGLRQWLNLGHTVGHALEGYSHHIGVQHGGRLLRHGEAVGIGLFCELYLSHKLFQADRRYLSELEVLLRAYHSPYGFSCKHYKEILTLLHQDKKNDCAEVSFMAFKSLGFLEKRNCSDEHLLDALDFYREMFGH